tara:strand:- start:663 stop:1532 length:870 start_codon:yes stop_codon:yes gene_type:complete
MRNKTKYYITKLGISLPRPLKKILRRITPNAFYDSLANSQVVLVSFPKCGRSWLRLMICDMVGHQFDNLNIVADTNLLWKVHPLIPYFTIDHDDASLKSPKDLNRDKSAFENKKVIFLVRDPRDVIVSWYFQIVKRGSKKWFNGKIKTNSVADFIDNEYGGLKTIIEFYNIWLRNKKTPKDFLLIKYEDLKNNPYKVLESINNFCGINTIISKSSILFAIENNSFEKLKSRERNQSIDHSAFKTFDTKDSEAFKVRKGKIGGYVDYLDEKQIVKMNEIICNELASEIEY